MRPGGTPQLRIVRALAVAGLACAATCACKPAAAPAQPAAAASRADPDFLAPPTVTRAERDGHGAVALHGRGPPGGRLALRSPDGTSADAAIDAAGDWSLRLPPASVPRAFAVSATDGPRVLRGEGALLVAPAPFLPAVMMRGGAPALPIGPSRRPGLRWTTVDTDPGGGAAASGFAPPGASLRLAIDGAVRGEGTADASGRFGVLWLGGAAPPGVHALTVSTPSASRTVQLAFGPVALDGAPVRIGAEGAGWRIDWSPPGGGVQTLHLLAPEETTP